MTTNTRLYEILSASANRQDPAVFKTLEALKENIREETCKRSGSAKKPAAIIKKMMNDNKKDPRRVLQGFHPYGDLKAFTDSFRVLASADSFGYDVSPDPLNIDKLIPNVSAYDHSITVTDELIADLKVFAKLHKKDGEPYVVITSDSFRMGFNPVYLLDAIEFTGGRVLHFNKGKHDNLRTPACIYTDDSVAMILPVCIDEMDAANTEVDYN